MMNEIEIQRELLNNLVKQLKTRIKEVQSENLIHKKMFLLIKE